MTTHDRPDDAEAKPVIIKKYANRRLYNTETSAYITLDDLAQLTREGREFKVVDAKTDDDITHSVLTQIIMDEEARGAQQMLPPAFLRQLISMYGGQMQGLVPHYLEASMETFRRNQAQFTDAMKGAFDATPFADIAKRNLAMFEAMTAPFKPPVRPSDAPSRPAPSAQDEEIAALRAELAALKAKVEKGE